MSSKSFFVFSSFSDHIKLSSSKPEFKMLSVPNCLFVNRELGNSIKSPSMLSVTPLTSLFNRFIVFICFSQCKTKHCIWESCSGNSRALSEFLVMQRYYFFSRENTTLLLPVCCILPLCWIGASCSTPKCDIPFKAPHDRFWRGVSSWPVAPPWAVR